MNKIYLIGDSTCHTNTKETYPQHGWGQVFSAFIDENYKVINLAENGRSSKSFLDEGLFKPCEENIEENDILFIQFGHNDEKEDEKRHTDPFTTYQQYLLYYINVARKVKAIPVLLSSIYRRHFDENGLIKERCHLDYPEAMRQLALKEAKFYIINANGVVRHCLVAILAVHGAPCPIADLLAQADGALRQGCGGKDHMYHLIRRYSIPHRVSIFNSAE
jgi:hypothetical protein